MYLIGNLMKADETLRAPQSTHPLSGTLTLPSEYLMNHMCCMTIGHTDQVRRPMLIYIVNT